MCQPDHTIYNGKFSSDSCLRRLNMPGRGGPKEDSISVDRNLHGSYTVAMIDVAKQVAYWRRSAEEDWAVAKKLVADESVRHGLFFAHLALEKIVKAHVCRTTKALAPKIYSLTRLAEIAELSLGIDYAKVLGEMNDFNLEGRYPEFELGVPTLVEARGYMRRSEEVYKWLLQELAEQSEK